MSILSDEYYAVIKKPIDETSAATFHDLGARAERTGDLPLALMVKSREVHAQKNVPNLSLDAKRVTAAEFIDLYGRALAEGPQKPWGRWLATWAAHHIALDMMWVLEVTWDEVELFVQFFESVIKDSGFSTHQPLCVRIQCLTGQDRFEEARPLGDRLAEMLPRLVRDRRKPPAAYTGALMQDWLVVKSSRGLDVTVEEAERILAPIFAATGDLENSTATLRAHTELARLELRDGHPKKALDHFAAASAAKGAGGYGSPNFTWLPLELCIANDSDREALRLAHAEGMVRLESAEDLYDQWYALRRLLVSADRLRDVSPDAAALEQRIRLVCARLDRRERAPIYTQHVTRDPRALFSY
jgi:hypothetical protein